MQPIGSSWAEGPQVEPRWAEELRARSLPLSLPLEPLGTLASPLPPRRSVPIDVVA